jgi:putative transposase
MGSAPTKSKDAKKAKLAKLGIQPKHANHANHAKHPKPRKRKRLKKGEQAVLPRTAGHGGKRAGAGRKAKAGRGSVRHLTRPGLGKKTPVHVTLRMMRGLPSLRSEVLRNMFERIVEQTRREDFHVPVYDLQDDHVHMISEPEDREALSSGIRRVMIRFALRLNRLLGRTKGKMWGDRYHRHDLKTPREVRNALVYVLMNGKKHGVCRREESFLDPFSSAAENDVWEDVRAGPRRVCERPRFWLLAVGWANGRGGRLRTTEAPHVRTVRTAA